MLTGAADLYQHIAAEYQAGGDAEGMEALERLAKSSTHTHSMLMRIPISSERQDSWGV